jgi:hypothetical protein
MRPSRVYNASTRYRRPTVLRTQNRTLTQNIEHEARSVVYNYTSAILYESICHMPHNYKMDWIL